jgi:hypothetical protein
MPLYFQNDQIGLALFGDGPDEGLVYELLRGQLSSALKGALLLRRLKERADILSKGIENLTLSLKGMVESSDAIVGLNNRFERAGKGLRHPHAAALQLALLDRFFKLLSILLVHQVEVEILVEHVFDPRVVQRRE